MTGWAPTFVLASWLSATPWIVMWAAVGGSGVLLVVLLRTKWADAKPWKKCAVLSLWVHVLLACIAATVRITNGGPGAGPGDAGPIRVAYISVEELDQDEPAPAVEAKVTPPPDEANAQAPDEEDSTVSAEPDEPAAVVVEQPAPPKEPANELELKEEDAATEGLAPPELLAAPAPPDDLESDDPEPPDSASPPAAETPATETTPDEERTDDPAEAPQTAPGAATDAPSPIDPPPVNPAPDTTSTPVPNPSAGIPAEYANRFAPNRAGLVAGGGGDPATERAVRAALAWLAKAQEPDGRWNPKRFGAGQERYVLGQNRGAAGASADTGVTGLALLAFLGAGHTQVHGDHAPQVARGLDYLRRIQASDGSLRGDAEFFAQMYCHSMATFAASEAHAITRDDHLAQLVRKSTAYSLSAQHPSDGGWRYRPGDQGDASQLGWQIMALRSASLAGLAVPDATWTRAERFIRRVERGQHRGLAAYLPVGPPSRTMTAEVLYCRQLLTGRADGGLTPAALDEAVRSLLDEKPSTSSVNLYYWYYGTLALHRAQHAGPQAADAWRQWNNSLATTLVAMQDADGSWPPLCIWGGYGGRVYSTALAAMCLEVYYRFAAPDAVEPDVAARVEWGATTK